jgi:hypothetical protein
MNRWRLWTLGFAVLGALSGCFGKQTFRWQEEVLLHDGRVIVIDRSVRTGEVPVEIGQAPGESDYTLTFKTSDGKPVTWDGGRDRFVPIVLDFVDEVPYVVAIGATGLVYPREGCPKPPYFFFHWSAGEWTRTRYEDFPNAVRNANLSAGLTYRASLRERIARSELITQEDVRMLMRTANPEVKMVREDAPNPCATWKDDFRYIPNR